MPAKHIPPFVRAAMRTGGDDAWIIRSASFGRVFRNLRKSFPMACCARCRKRRHDRTASSSSSQTAGRMQPSCLPACDSAHYRDALRQSLTEALKTAGRGTLAFRDQIAGQQLDQERVRLAAQFVATHPTEANILNSAANSALANLPAPGDDQLTYAQAAQRIIQRGEYGPFPVRQLTQDIAACLLARDESWRLCPGSLMD